MIDFSFGSPCFCCRNCRKHGTLIRNRMEIFVRINTYFNWLSQYVQWARLVDILDLVSEVMWNIFWPFVRLSVRLSVFFLLDPPREIFRYICFFACRWGVIYIFVQKCVLFFWGTSGSRMSFFKLPQQTMFLLQTVKTTKYWTSIRSRVEI